MLSEAVADMTPLQSRHQCFLGVIQLNSHSKAPNPKHNCARDSRNARGASASTSPYVKAGIESFASSQPSKHQRSDNSCPETSEAAALAYRDLCCRSCFGCKHVDAGLPWLITSRCCSRMVSSPMLLLASAVLLLGSAAQAASHTFQPNVPVKLYANKVGPFSNPRYRGLGQRL